MLQKQIKKSSKLTYVQSIQKKKYKTSPYFYRKAQINKFAHKTCSYKK